MEEIVIRGARQHNLKNISVRIPKQKLVVFTGLSGSGKSSLAFDTIYAEGQRRYVESLSSYARQFLGVMGKPQVDTIDGLSPAISIDQKSTSHNPRSTVGTVTEIYDYLRLLFARIGHPHCHACGREISRMSLDQIVQAILQMTQASLTETTKQYRLMILSPVVRDHKGEFSGLFANLRSKGFQKIRVDNVCMDLASDVALIKTNKHSIDVVIDRISLERTVFKKEFLTSIRSRLAVAVEQSLSLSDGLVIVSEILDRGFGIPSVPTSFRDHIFSEKFSCPSCNISIPEIEPRSFSFNSPHGACPSCTGLGTILSVDPDRIFSPELSITEGGILPFAKTFSHDSWFSRTITVVAQKHGINPKAPLKNLTSEQKHILLYGTSDQRYIVQGTNRFGEQTEITETFEGFIPLLKRRYSETESEYIRTEIEKYMRQEICRECNGKRLKQEILSITIDQKSIADITDMSISDMYRWSRALSDKNCTLLSDEEKTIAYPVLKEVTARLGFLTDVGLGYLTLARGASTLAGGEAQRIRLASQIGSGLTGVLYVLDEPSIGLHPRDNHRLIQTLKSLQGLGNSLIVVEHDREMIESADWIIDFGPGAGKHGGAIVAMGAVAQVSKDPKSITGAYLSGRRRIHIPHKNRAGTDQGKLMLHGVTHHNLQNIHCSFPLGTFICVTGVSGSGKSSLVVDTLYPALYVFHNPSSRLSPGNFQKLSGAEQTDKVILIDQSPIGKTPRSNPATYTGLFTLIREVFANLSESRLRGYSGGRFSFNVKGGRCETCQGEGTKKIEMQFLADVYVTCEVCKGSRYNTETLEVTYKGRNIAEILAMTVAEAMDFFHAHPKIFSQLETLSDVGLSYIQLGQPAPTLSGGEAQRVKLSSELSRRATGKTVYILDEPTTGLHFADLEKLLTVLHALVAKGNTVIVIEHNLDVIRSADWVIDLGPEGGTQGGNIIAQGSPSDIARNKNSYTGRFLNR